MPTEVVAFAAALVSLGVVLVALLLRLIRVMSLLRRFEQRLSHLADGLTLLTETTESGFRSVGAELGRLAEITARRAPRRTTNARVGAAARRGQSVKQIAAQERISEGEVSLRLHLAQAERAGGGTEGWADDPLLRV